jgi:hypothetical protein
MFVRWRVNVNMVKIVLKAAHFREPLQCFWMLYAHGGQKFWPIDGGIAQSRFGCLQKRLGEIKRDARGATITENLITQTGIHIYIDATPRSYGWELELCTRRYRSHYFGS